MDIGLKEVFELGGGMGGGMYVVKEYAHVDSLTSELVCEIFDV